MTWYDQSGNGRDATQTTAANQPQIVSSGSVINVNSKPSLQFDGSGDIMKFIGSGTSSSNTLFVLSKCNNLASTYQTITSIGDIRPSSAFCYMYFNPSNADKRVIYSDSTVSQDGSRTTNQELVAIDAVSSNISMFVNNSSVSLTNSSRTLTTNLNNLQIGNDTQYNDHFNGNIQEIILYTTSQTSNVSGINSNINDFYQMYWDGSQTSVLDSYGGSAAAYSLRALSSAYVGPLVRVRRASDNAEQDIYANYDGTLNTSSLESFCSGTDGFVETWYDQSGNGHNFAQTTASLQPQIVSGGTYLQAINMDNTDDYMVAVSNYTAQIQQSIFTVFQRGSITTGQRPLLASNNLNDCGFFYSSSIGLSYDPNRRQGSLTSINYPTSIALYSLFKTNNGNATDVLFAFVNSVSSGNKSGTLTGNAITLNYLNRSVTPDDKKIKEIIIYTSDQSSNRTGIETNINDFYSIY